MSPIAIAQTTVEAAPVNPKLMLRGDAPKLDVVKPDQPQWLQELWTRGWTIVPGVIAKETANSHADKIYSWLESWGLGFDRNDPNTRTEEMLPFCMKGGLYASYGVAHEQFVWDAKCVEACSKCREGRADAPQAGPGCGRQVHSDLAGREIDRLVWCAWTTFSSLGHRSLADGINASVARRDPEDDLRKPWAHVDQSPLDKDLHCVQGILNLLPNGPKDGGLMVMENSSKLYTELFDAFEHQ